MIDRFVHRRLHVWCDMGDDEQATSSSSSFSFSPNSNRSKGGLGGGWTLVQRRGQHGNPPGYFYRAWDEYLLGFGHLEGEFWMGLDNIQVVDTNKNNFKNNFSNIL